MKYFQKKIASIIAVFLVFLIFNFLNFYVILAQNNEDSSMVDVVFVVDSSKSMKASDPEGLTAEAMKMFIDMCHVKGDKGGMVAYSGDIIKEYKLNYLNSVADKSALKDTLTGLELGDWTDIGLGLKKAVSTLKDGHDKNNKPIIILLSDGKNDPQRYKAASQDDLAAGLNEAKVQNFPIYTIGLNADGTVDKNQLELISKETNGKNFTTNTANDLPQILREIFADNSRLKISQQQTIIGNDEFQDVKINIPDSNIVEANISILSSKPVELKLNDTKGNEVKIPSEKVLYTNSNKYSMLKLISPEKGEWLIRIKGSKADQIDISLISNYDLKTVISLNPETNIHKGDKVEVSAYIESNGQKLEDNEFYAALKATLYVKNLESGETKELSMTSKDNKFVEELTIQDENSYELIAKIEGPGFIRESATKNIGAVNRAPSVTKKINSLVLWNKNIKKINLSEYFNDWDNDKLNYAVSSGSLDTLNLKINNNILEIQGRKWGKDTITVIANDGKGGKVSSEISVKVNLVFYIVAGLAGLLIIIIFAVLIRKIIQKNSESPTGQMMVQIRYDVTGSVSSQQYKPLSQFKGSFSTHNLLNLNPDYEETSKIKLKAGAGDTLILTNKSQCIIETSGRKVDASKGIIIRNNDKLAIVIIKRKEIIVMQYFNR